MRVAHITPINYLTSRTDYHMALTHLVLEGNEKYINHFRCLPSNDYIILDNSVIELGTAVSIEQVLEAAKIIGADEIILPDAFCDKDRTIELLNEIMSTQKYHDIPYKMMAVPQGKTVEDWFECYNYILDLPIIHTIGIPKVIDAIFPGGRLALLDFLDDYLLIDESKEYHLLGVWNNPIEIRWAATFDWIRGVDSSVAYVCGSRGIRFDPYAGAEKPDCEWDFYETVPEEALNDVLYNMEVMEEWASK